MSTHPYCDKDLDYSGYSPAETDIIISREKYLDQLQGFWLGQSIGNWTGIISEMDIVDGFVGHGKKLVKHQMMNVGSDTVKVLLVEHKKLELVTD